MALALITLAVLGPLPALCVDLVPMTVGALVRREPLARAGNLANVAAYGWKALAAAGILALGAPEGLPAAALPWLLLAAAMQLLVNWAVGPAIYGTLWLGHPFSAMARMLADIMPGRRRRAHARRVDQRAHRAARPVRARACSPASPCCRRRRSPTRPAPARSACSTPRRQRTATRTRSPCTWACDAASAGTSPASPSWPSPAATTRGDPIAYARSTLARPQPRLLGGRPRRRVVERRRRPGRPARRGHALERPHRRGGRHLERLTARGGPQLSHAEALGELDNASGSRFDPRVVLAAHAVVAEERVSVPRAGARAAPAPAGPPRPAAPRPRRRLSDNPG